MSKLKQTLRLVKLPEKNHSAIRLITLILIVFTLGGNILFAQPLSGVKTIGGVGPDYASFTDAVIALSVNGVMGPVTFNVRTATYNEQISIPVIAGASAVNTITFQSETGVKTDVLLTHVGSSLNPYTIRLNSADFFTFRNMSIQMTGIGVGNTIELLNGADNNHFENNNLERILPIQNRVIYSSNTLDINNVIENNNIIGGSYGIYFEGVDAANQETGNEIRGNTLTEQSSNGIYIRFNADIQTIGNTIINPLSISGITLERCVGTAGNRSLTANNMVQVNASQQTWGIAVTICEYQDIFHNSVHITGSNAKSRAFFHPTNNPSTDLNIRIKNNIFANTAGGLAIYVFRPENITESDFNNYYATGAFLAKWGPASETAFRFRDLAALKSASGLDANSIHVDPLFNSSTNLHTNSPILDGAATPLSAVTDDRDGDTRSLTTPDIGADEYTSTNPCMSGIFTIDSAGTGDYLNFSEALADISGRGVCGSVVVNVADGTYNERLQIYHIFGTSATNTVTFQGNLSDSTLVKLTNIDFINQFLSYTIRMTGYETPIASRHSQYVTFRKMHIEYTSTSGFGSGGSTIQLANGANNNRFEGNKLERTNISGGPQFAVIYSTNTLDIDNTIEGNLITGGPYGIYFEGVDAANQETGNEIRGNTLTEQSSNGIYIRFNADIQTIGNTIINPLSISGITLERCVGTAGNRSLTANNMVQVNASQQTWGIAVTICEYQDIFHNSVHITGSNAKSRAFFHPTNISSDLNIRIKNNIFANTAEGLAIYVFRPENITESDFNNYYTTGAFIAKWGPASETSFLFTDLAALQTASGQDANSVSVDPAFTSPTDLHLTILSPISLVGIGLSSIVPDDIDGDIRNIVTPNMGADEFVSPCTTVISVTTSGTGTSCNGTCEGTATATPSGATPPLTFIWDDPLTQSTATAIGLCAGTYNVTVIDANSCLTIGVYIVTEPDVLTATTSVTDVTCNSNCDGAVAAVVSGGTPPYIYQWDDPLTQTTVTAVGLCPGTYNVTVTDVNGCETGIFVVSQEVYVPTSSHNVFFDRPPLQDLSFINDGSFGLVDGTIWESAPSTFELTMTFPSSVILDEVRVAGGQFNGQFNIPPLMELHRGSSSGPLLLTIVLPTDLNLNSSTFSNTVSSAVYTWVITSNSNGFASLQEIECFGSGIVPVSGTVNEPIALSLTTSTTDASCIGNDGTASVTVTGGTPPYSFLWDDPLTQTTSTAVGLTPNSYVVQVTDDNGCISTETAVVGDGCIGCGVLATANAGADAAICEGSTHTMAGSFGGSASSILWTTSGSGVFTLDTDPTTTYTPSAADITAGTVTLTITTDDPDGAGPCLAATDFMILTINPIATTSAGADATICEGSNHVMAGSFGGGASSITWTTSGTGAFTLATDPTTLYTPSAADILAGTVTLTITTDDPAGPCGTATDFVILTINPLATTSAGADATICSGSTHTMAGTFGGGASSITWTTSGTGVLTLASDPTTVYTPSAADITAGTVTLTITTDDPDGAGPCLAVTDFMVLTINPVATTSAGADVTICEGSTNVMAGSFGGSASSITWTTSGSGVFVLATSPTTTYTPSAADITAGTVTLTITTDDPDGAGPCLAATDFMILTIDPLAATSAGANATICSGSTHTMAGTFGGGASSITWTTSGTGAFTLATDPTTVYTPSAADITAGTVTLTITTDDPAGPCGSVTDFMILTINPLATTSAGADATICSGSTHTMSGTFGGGASSITWTTSGTGVFTLPTDPTTVYTPSAADVLAGTVTLTITTDDPAGPCPSVSDDMILTIDPAATVSAGVDATICEGSTHTMAGIFGGGASSITWTTSGDGGFALVTDPTTVYTPGAADILAGTVTLTITTDDPAGPCGSVTDFMILAINPIATVAAGADATICEGSTHTMTGSFGGGASSITWTTTGTGVFILATDPTTVYTPSAVDILAGTVTLTITTDDPAGPCGTATDFVVLIINPIATVAAGPDATICEGSTHTMAGSFGGSASSILWTTSGTGVFTLATDPTTVYTPSAADITAGTVTLTITTDDPDGAGPCLAATDFMILTINLIATTTAGPDATICEGSTHVMAGSFGGGASSITWTTSGTGVFTLATDPTTVYTPSAADILAGTVTLTITTDDPAGPCPLVSDDMVLTIDPAATVSAGADATICEGSTHTMAGTFGGGASSITWTTSGTGVFILATDPTTVYTPSAVDILAGTVTLTITTDDPAGPCGTATDFVVLTINPLATVAAGPDATICSGSTHTMAGSFGGGASSITWTTSGTGVFTLATDPTTVYTPSASDILAGTVTLTITTDDPVGPCPAVSDFMVLTIDPSPIVDAGPDRTVITGFPPGLNADCADLTAAVTGGLGPFTYLWSTGATTSTITVCPNVTTVFTVTVTGANNCFDSDEVKVEVIDASNLPACPAPPANKIEICHVANCTTQCVNEFGLCANCLIIHLSHGDYLGPCTGSGPCPPPSTCKTGAPITDEGTDQVNEEALALNDPFSDFAHEYSLDKTTLVFPNPNNGEFTLVMVAANKRVLASIYLYNTLGELIYKEEDLNRYVIYFDISDQPKGMYFIRVVKGNSIYTNKITYQ